MSTQQLDQNAQRVLGKMAEWTADGDTWIGVFENHEIGHRYMGERCAFPFKRSDGSMDMAEVGKTRAPDGPKIGMGWRYILIGKHTEAEPAMRQMLRMDEKE